MGRVKLTDEDADVKIEVGGQSWTYNPYCLKPAPGERLSESQSRCKEQKVCMFVVKLTQKLILCCLNGKKW